jgi:surface carbohydrate biosynthesis protein
MQKKRIYTVIEVKERELLAKILFGIRMAKKGYSIVIGKKNSLFNYSEYFRTGIFFFKGMGEKNIKPMKKLSELGHKIVGFDEEGLVMNQVETIPVRIRKECLNLVEYFFTVGKKQSQNTLKVYKKLNKKIYEIGNSRFDLLKKNNKDFFNDEVNKIKIKYGKFIFFPTKLTIVNNAFFTGIPKSNKGPGRFVQEKGLEDQKKIEKKLLSFFNYFPKKYPGVKIIIKPHPSENKNYWIKLIKKISCHNLILADNSYSTNSYILASEFNVGSNCHTSLESYLCNKPTINMRPSKNDGYVISDLIRAVSGKEILKKNEFEKIIVNWFFKNKKFNNKLNKKELKILNYNIQNIKKESFYYFENKIRNIKILNKKNSDRFSNFFFLKLLEFIRRLKNRYYSLKSHKIKRSYQEIKFSGLTIEEFESYTSKICNVLKIKYKDILVREIYPGCFCIEKNSK